MFSIPFRAARDHHIYITMFKTDGLGLTDHEHWGMSVKSTHLALDYSDMLKRSWLHEEASFATLFSMPLPLHLHVLHDRKKQMVVSQLYQCKSQTVIDRVNVGEAHHPCIVIVVGVIVILILSCLHLF